MTDTDTCSVCCFVYTASVRKPVPCASCSYAACANCVKTFLLSTKAEPHCMNCRHVWNREFLDIHLTRSWREGELKRHREAVLFDRERSLLPASQPAVELRREKDDVEKAMREAKAELKLLRVRKSELKDIVDRNHYFLKEGRWPSSSAGAGAGAGAGAEPRRQFVAACPSADCRGFLSTAYKCGVCSHQFCSHCRELNEDKTHTCDPDLVATMKAIVSESRPCPTCGMAISRVSGCDQMFCIQCDTAFSYLTGKIVTGVIHNPHYFERMAKLKTAAADQLMCEANGWPHFRRVFTNNPVTRFLAHPVTVMITRLYQLGVHIQEVELPSLPQPDIAIDNTDLRVQYLLKEIDEKQLRQKLQRRTRKRDLYLEIRSPLELAAVTILEFMVWLAAPEQHVIANKNMLIPEISDRATALSEYLTGYVNDSLRAIGDRYGNQVPQILLKPRGHRRAYTLDWHGYKPAKMSSMADSEAVIEHH